MALFAVENLDACVRQKIVFASSPGKFETVSFDSRSRLVSLLFGFGQKERILRGQYMRVSGVQGGPYGSWLGRSTFVLLFVERGAERYMSCEMVFERRY